MHHLRRLAVFALLTLCVSDASAQETGRPVSTLPPPVKSDSAAATVDTTFVQMAVPEGRGITTLRVAKWSVLAASGGAAVYGFVSNRRADDRYNRIEQVCVDEPARCGASLPDGTYADPALEAEYQDVRAIDRRAKTALIASQVGVAASVVLFILDLRNEDAPRNIPYEPRRFDVGPSRDGGLSMTVNLKTR